jgi:hypothetical protein
MYHVFETDIFIIYRIRVLCLQLYPSLCCQLLRNTAIFFVLLQGDEIEGLERVLGIRDGGTGVKRLCFVGA